MDESRASGRAISFGKSKIFADRSRRGVCADEWPPRVPQPPPPSSTSPHEKQITSPVTWQLTT